MHPLRLLHESVWQSFLFVAPLMVLVRPSLWFWYNLAGALDAKKPFSKPRNGWVWQNYFVVCDIIGRLKSLVDRPNENAILASLYFRLEFCPITYILRSRGFLLTLFQTNFNHGQKEKKES